MEIDALYNLSHRYTTYQDFAQKEKQVKRELGGREFTGTWAQISVLNIPQHASIKVLTLYTPVV